MAVVLDKIFQSCHVSGPFFLVIQVKSPFSPILSSGYQKPRSTGGNIYTVAEETAAAGCKKKYAPCRVHFAITINT